MGVYLREAFVVDPRTYLLGLLAACHALAAQRGDGSALQLHVQPVSGLQQAADRFAAGCVIAATGAATGALQDVNIGLDGFMELSQVSLISWVGC